MSLYNFIKLVLVANLAPLSAVNIVVVVVVFLQRDRLDLECFSKLQHNVTIAVVEVCVYINPNVPNST